MNYEIHKPDLYATAKKLKRENQELKGLIVDLTCELKRMVEAVVNGDNKAGS